MLQGAVTGVMSQLVAAVTCDSSSMIVASGGLVGSAIAVGVDMAVGVAKDRSSRARDSRRSSVGGLRSKPSRRLGIGSSSLGVTLVCTGLRHLPLVRL